MACNRDEPVGVANNGKQLQIRSGNAYYAIITPSPHHQVTTNTKHYTPLSTHTSHITTTNAVAKERILRPQPQPSTTARHIQKLTSPHQPAMPQHAKHAKGVMGYNGDPAAMPLHAATSSQTRETGLRDTTGIFPLPRMRTAGGTGEVDNR